MIDEVTTSVMEWLMTQLQRFLWVQRNRDVYILVRHQWFSGIGESVLCRMQRLIGAEREKNQSLVRLHVVYDWVSSFVFSPRFEGINSLENKRTFKSLKGSYSKYGPILSTLCQLYIDIIAKLHKSPSDQGLTQGLGFSGWFTFQAGVEK